MKKLFLVSALPFAFALIFSCAKCRTTGCHQDMSQAAAFVNDSPSKNISYYSNSFHLSAPSRNLACKQLETEEKNYGPTCRVEWK